MRVTLIEASKILGAFDSRLQEYAEKKIRQRDQFRLIKDAVSGRCSFIVICQVVICLLLFDIRSLVLAIEIMYFLGHTVCMPDNVR